MNAQKMLTSLIPWVAFSLIVEQRGANAAAVAAIAATLLALFLLVRDRAAGIKVIDVAGVATFAVLSVVAMAGTDAIRSDVANYGRGGSTLVLAAVMLGSVLVLPFTEQYARESVPRQYWGSPVFRSVNRRLSAAWGLAVTVVGAGHLLAGDLQANGSSSLVIKLVLNWVVPAALAFAAMTYTKHVAGSDAAVAV